MWGSLAVCSCSLLGAHATCAAIWQAALGPLGKEMRFPAQTEEPAVSLGWKSFLGGRTAGCWAPINLHLLTALVDCLHRFLGFLSDREPLLTILVPEWQRERGGGTQPVLGKAVK